MLEGITGLLVGLIIGSALTFFWILSRARYEKFKDADTNLFHKEQMKALQFLNDFHSSCLQYNTRNIHSIMENQKKNAFDWAFSKLPTNPTPVQLLEIGKPFTIEQWLTKEEIMELKYGNDLHSNYLAASN